MNAMLGDWDKVRLMTTTVTILIKGTTVTTRRMITALTCIIPTTTKDQVTDHDH